MEIAEGYYILPRGRLANAVTWLEREVAPGVEAPARDGCSLEPLGAGDCAAYRDIYARVGTDWLWSSRLAMSDAELAAHLAASGIETYVARSSGQGIGLLEMEHTPETGVEVLYFGLISAAIGQGVGRWLMQQAVAAASRRGAVRIWLHTCNYDHPSALRFYQSCGFRIYAQGFEVMDDPRVSGRLPRSAARHVPMLGEGD